MKQGVPTSVSHQLQIELISLGDASLRAILLTVFWSSHGTGGLHGLMKKLLGTSAVIRASNRGSSWKCGSFPSIRFPLFDSMSGNGKATPDRADITTSVKLPFEFSSPVVTSGCVTTGPFANAEAPFGPVTIRLNASYIDNPKNLEHKPHCLRRDLNPGIVSAALEASYVDTLLQTPNITSFINVLEQGLIQWLRTGIPVR